MRPNLIGRLKEEWNNLDPVDPLRGLISDAIYALAEQTAQGCEFCSHPLYAGTKCKNCGLEQPAQQDIPKIGCVNHDCDQCKAQQQQEPGAWLTGCPECGMDGGCDCSSGTWNPPASKPLPTGFIDAVVEAAAILSEIDPDHAPKHMRWPLADELGGFVLMLKDEYDIKENNHE